MSSPLFVSHVSICASLRTLTFEEVLLRLLSSVYTMLLSQIISSALQKISLWIRCSTVVRSPREMNTFPLEHVGEILTEPRFSGVQRVVSSLYEGSSFCRSHIADQVQYETYGQGGSAARCDESVCILIPEMCQFSDMLACSLILERPLFSRVWRNSTPVIMRPTPSLE